MAQRNKPQMDLIPDERLNTIPEEYTLSDADLRTLSALPEDRRRWDSITSVTDVLNEITGAHAEKKKATILALVQARLNNQTARSVFADPAYCNESTYHKKWKHDPVFARVFDYVMSAATTLVNAEELIFMVEARRYVQRRTPQAAKVLIKTLDDERSDVALKAAIETLKITKTFDPDGPAVVINNNVEATADANQGMTFDEWEAAAAESREDADEAFGVSMEFAEIDRKRADENGQQG